MRAVVLVTHEFPTVEFHGNVRIVRPLDYAGYSQFVVADLADLVATPHALIVQHDGFVLNPQRWDDAFLRYDYVGAPWPDRQHANIVGNGGFSLRSRRLLEWGRGRTCLVAEDSFICHDSYAELVAAGMAFAPLEIAQRFSLERIVPQWPDINDLTTFGFHGKDTEHRRRLCELVCSGVAA